MHPLRALKKFTPKSLYARTLLIIILPMVLLQVSLGYIFFDRHTSTILKQMSASLAGNIALASSLIPKDPALASFLGHTMQFEINYIPEKRLNPSALQSDDWITPHMHTALKHFLSFPYVLHVDEDYIYVTVEAPKGLLAFKFLRKKLFSRTTPIVIIWTAISALILSLVAALFMKNQVRPIKYLADAADKFGKDMDISGFRPEGAEEVRRAGIAFNIMRERLKKQMKERTEMLAGVSHDLRTPLSRMKLQLALMSQNDDTQNLRADVQQMQDMLQGFLDFAHGQKTEMAELMDIRQLVEKTVAALRLETLHVTIEGEKSIKWMIKPTLINRSLTNLLLNSKRYAQSVVINIKELPQSLIITVEDDGPGIPLEKREEVFKPFVRLDESRNVDGGSIGLGLSIVKDAIHSHGGQVYLEDAQKTGLRVVIELPK